VWAIGTGRTATPDDAQHDVCGRSVDQLHTSHGEHRGRACAILYGGSVKPGNIRAADRRQDDVDGVLVGGASLSSEDFALIVSHRR
jgi:triosephosphate isomerase (TIM)